MHVKYPLLNIMLKLHGYIVPIAKLDQLQIGQHLTATQQRELKNLLMEFGDLFSFPVKPLGFVTDITGDVITMHDNHQPLYSSIDAGGIFFVKMKYMRGSV